jgi:hypothetical protein
MRDMGELVVSCALSVCFWRGLVGTIQMSLHKLWIKHKIKVAQQHTKVAHRFLRTVKAINGGSETLL